MNSLSSAPDGLSVVVARILSRSIASGIAGIVAWEFFARLVAPLWLGFPMDPTPLIEMAIGLSGVPALLLHLATGLFFYPLGYVVVVRPLADRIVPSLPLPLIGLGYGVALWVFAMYGMASLLGGMPPFLGFQPIAWASLAGHLGLGLGISVADWALARERAGWRNLAGP